MPATPSDLEDTLRKIRYDLTAAQAKVTDALTQLSAIAVREPGQHVCPKCGIERPTAEMLQDHMALLHDDAPHPPPITEAVLWSDKPIQ